MARLGITYEEVVAEAEAMVGAGKRPTIDAVRGKIGGSPNTVHKHLTTWRSAQPVAQAVARTLPAGILDAIASEISKAVADARSELATQLGLAQDEARQLAATGETLETQIEDLTEQMQGIATERDAATATATERGTEIERQAQEIKCEQTSAEAARVELAKAQLKIESSAERLTELNAEVARLRTALDSESNARVAAEKSAAVLAARLEAATERALKAETRSDVFEKQVQAVGLELGSSKLQVQAQQGALDASVRDLVSVKAELKSAREVAKQAGEDAAVLRSQMSAQKVEIDGFKKAEKK